jgi:hypothetical protein
MRCFFNLVSAHSSIPDLEGVEVADMEELRAEVSKAIEEMRLGEPDAARDWNGWRMEVTDPKGAILLTIDLSPSRSE